MFWNASPNFIRLAVGKAFFQLMVQLTAQLLGHTRTLVLECALPSVGPNVAVISETSAINPLVADFLAHRVKISMVVALVNADMPPATSCSRNGQNLSSDAEKRQRGTWKFHTRDKTSLAGQLFLRFRSTNWRDWGCRWVFIMKLEMINFLSKLQKNGYSDKQSKGMWLDPKHKLFTEYWLIL